MGRCICGRVASRGSAAPRRTSISDSPAAPSIVPACVPARGNRVIVLYYWQVIEATLQEISMPIYETENITCVEPADSPASRVSWTNDNAQVRILGGSTGTEVCVWLRWICL